MNGPFYLAEVRNIKDDKTKSGRVQLRVYGIHDDEENIKDEQENDENSSFLSSKVQSQPAD